MPREKNKVDGGVGTKHGASVFQRLREVRRIAQPPEFSPSLTDIPYRAVSIFPSLFLARIRFTPNQITVLWIIVGLAGVVALASSDYWFRVMGALCLQLSYLLDFVDGEVARLQGSSSKRGLFLDLIGHGVVKTGLFLSLGYYVWVSSGRVEMVLLSFVAIVSVSNGHMLPFYARQASVSNQPISRKVQPNEQTDRSAPEKLLALVDILFESPGLYAMTLLGSVLDLLGWVVLFYGVTGPLWYVNRALRYRHE